MSMNASFSLLKRLFTAPDTPGRLRDNKVYCSTMSVRYQMAFLSSLGFLIAFGIRCNMGVSIVAMNVNQTETFANGTIKSIRVRSMTKRRSRLKVC